METIGRPRTGSLAAVLFDLDGVLADTEPLNAEAYLRAFRSLGVAVEASAFRRAVLVDGKRVTELFGELGGRASVEELYRAKDALFLGELGAHLRPRDGIEPLLAELVAAHVPCGVVTTSRRVNVDFILARFGWADRFDVVVSLEDVLHPKPDPEPYRLALRRLDVPATNVAAVEDSPHGVRAAAAAGLTVVGAPAADTPGIGLPGAHLVVTDLRDLTLVRLEALMDAESHSGSADH